MFQLTQRLILDRWEARCWQINTHESCPPAWNGHSRRCYFIFLLQRKRLTAGTVCGRHVPVTDTSASGQDPVCRNGNSGSQRSKQPPTMVCRVAQGTLSDVSDESHEVSITCYVDALDECNTSDARDTIELFESVGQLVSEKKASFRVLLSSRHYPQIDIAICQQMILEG